MARSKKNKGKKSKPGGKKGKKQKYGLRAPVKAKKKLARKKVASKKKAAKKKQTRKKSANRETGSPEAELMWDANYARARALHAEDPQNWWEGMTGEDKSFGAWLQTQRYNRKVGRLRKDRETRLKKIKFVWDTVEASWERHLKELKKIMRSAGKMWWKKLPQANPKLELWCDAQRRARSRGELAEDRATKLEDAGFVWSSLEAMWELRFAELVEVLQDHPHGRVSKENASGELVVWVFTQHRKFAAGELSPEREQRLGEAGFRWDGRQAKSDEIWEGHFADLAAYHELSGDADPGPDDDDETFRWLVGQRKIWDEMPAERRARLEEIDVSESTPAEQIQRRSAKAWVPDWNKFFRDATAFKEKFGHLRIGRDEGSAAFPGLANFAGKLRTGALEPDAAQRDKLERIGFVWDIRAARAGEFFDTRFADLLKYKKKHGDTNVSQLSKTHRALGQWVNRLRLTRHELPEEQRAQLEGIGFVWELKKEWMEGQWETRFAELLEYKRQHGDCLVPQVCPDWYTLSRWVSRMRQTKDELDAERIRRLDEAGFIWDAKAAERAATEEARYTELVAFVKENGHARVTRGNDPSGGILNRWIVRQRDKKKKGAMDAELEQRLDALGFLWTTR
jgi:hypothetical protein